MTIPRGSYDALESEIALPAIIVAPVAQGQALAEISVNLNEDVIVTAPLLALEDNPDGSLWQVARDSVSLLFE